MKGQVLDSLLKAIVKGALAGAGVFTSAFALFGLLKGLSEYGLIVLVYPPFTAVYGVLDWLSWIPIGAFTGIIVELCKLSGTILGSGSRKLIIAIGSICVASGLLYTAQQVAGLRRSEAVAIAESYSDFCQYYRAKDFGKAYSFMSPSYRQSHTLEDFKSDFGFIDHGWDVLHHNYSARFNGERAYLFPGNAYPIEINWSGPTLTLEKIEGVWYFTGEQYWSWD